MLEKKTVLSKGWFYETMFSLEFSKKSNISIWEALYAWHDIVEK